MRGGKYTAAVDFTHGAYLPLWERLSQLRMQARREARAVTITITLSCIVLGLFVSLYSLFLVALYFATSGTGYASLRLRDLFAFWLLVALCVGFVSYCVFRLLVSRRLFHYHYQQTWRYLAHTDLALRIALDPFFNEISFRLAENGQHISYYLPHDPSVENALEIRCGFINSFIAVTRNEKNYAALPWDMQGWIAFRLAAEFKPSWLKYLGCFGGCLISLGTLIPNVATVKMSVGPAIIASRAVLVAFLDFMLEEPPVWVDQLTPPSDAKRPWWWRSVAPLLRDAG